ncbi:MAG: hypothetical protein OHK0013_30580 [Sandaracinaceae bacterium]
MLFSLVTEMLRARSFIMGTVPVVVRSDRPFLFVLRDVRTGAVLFLGRVGDPR